jgi:hypothetical protein
MLTLPVYGLLISLILIPVYILLRLVVRRPLPRLVIGASILLMYAYIFFREAFGVTFYIPDPIIVGGGYVTTGDWPLGFIITAITAIALMFTDIAVQATVILCPEVEMVRGENVGS